jgi:hypothetical protein
MLRDLCLVELLRDFSDVDVHSRKPVQPVATQLAVLAYRNVRDVNALGAFGHSRKRIAGRTVPLDAPL